MCTSQSSRVCLTCSTIVDVYPHQTIVCFNSLSPSHPLTLSLSYTNYAIPPTLATGCYIHVHIRGSRPDPIQDESRLSRIIGPDPHPHPSRRFPARTVKIERVYSSSVCMEEWCPAQPPRIVSRIAVEGIDQTGCMRIRIKATIDY
jgi:hypothetical protein